MFLNGSLENFSVADILQLLSFSKQTGALHVTGETNGVLFLDDGEAYFATKEGSWPTEDTGAAAGIPREDWNAAIERGGQSHAAGQVLVERGIAADLVGYFVHQVVSDTTFELMRMPRDGGAFDFRVGEKHEFGPVHKLRIDELVPEVRDRLAEWEAISEFISSPSELISAPYELSEESVELSVSREQWALLVATIRRDGATVAELARETGRSEAEVATALHPLIGSGVVEVGGRTDTGVATPPAVAETAPYPPPSVFESDPGPLAPEVLEELDSPDSPPVPGSLESDYSDDVLQEAAGSVSQEEPTSSWWHDRLDGEAEGLPSDQAEGLPSDQAEGLPSDQEEEGEVPSDAEQPSDAALSWGPVEAWDDSAPSEEAEHLPSHQTEGLPSDQAEGLPSDQAELELLHPEGPQLDEWRFESDSEEQEKSGDSEDWFSTGPAPEDATGTGPERFDPLDPDLPLFESDQGEGTDEPGSHTETGSEADTPPAWDIEGAVTDLEETHPGDEQQAELFSSDDLTGEGPPEIESMGTRTLALQELRDLAGTASVQPATTPRSTSSRKAAETSDDKPPAQPKVRALRRIIAAVRGL
jgi:hypothetical protein